MVRKISRRQALAAVAGGFVAAQTQQVHAQRVSSSSSLGAIAAKSGHAFGASAGPIIFSDAPYRELYIAQTKLITTDVALKIGSIAGKPGPKNFAPADKLLAFCDSNKIPMRGHCLIWNEWVPAWIKQMSTAERRAFFDAYIDEVVGRYAGKLQSWDVVNEPFWPGHHAPGGFRMGPWYDAFGTDYIGRAFERAAGADRTTKLVLNEAQTERDDELGLTIRRGLLKLVGDLKHSGVKLDVVGLQGHLQPQYPHDPARYSQFLHELADYGVDIYITEFDVRDDTLSNDVETRDKQVASIAGRFLDTVLHVPAVKAVITWQLADNFSFYTDIARHKDPTLARPPRPLPYDGELKRKPLWYSMARAFETARA